MKIRVLFYFFFEAALEIEADVPDFHPRLPWLDFFDFLEEDSQSGT